MADPIHVNLAGRWRVGRKVGRTIYAQQGPEPSDDDPLIGVMDYPALATLAVEGHNASLDRTAETCDDHHIFPRDTFAKTARAEVWCDKPAGHKGAHEAVKNSMAFVWTNDEEGDK